MEPENGYETWEEEEEDDDDDADAEVRAWAVERGNNSSVIKRIPKWLIDISQVIESNIYGDIQEKSFT